MRERELGRETVDVQCMYVALGAREHVSSSIGAGEWSDTERTGPRPSSPSAKNSPPSFAAALKDASSALSAIAADVAEACQVSRHPKEVRLTFDRIMIALQADWPPFLLVDAQESAWATGDAVEDGTREWLARTIFTRKGVPERSAVVAWAPPASIDLTLCEGAEQTSTRFDLSASNRWVSGDNELFVAVREAIRDLYPELARVKVSFTVARPTGSLPTP